MNNEKHLLYTVLVRTQVPRTSVKNTPQSRQRNVSKTFAKLQGLSFECITRTFVENVLLQPTFRTIFYIVQCKYRSDRKRQSPNSAPLELSRYIRNHDVSSKGPSLGVSVVFNLSLEVSMFSPKALLWELGWEGSDKLIAFILYE